MLKPHLVGTPLLVAVIVLAPSAMFAQGGQALSITNYQLVSDQSASPPQSYVTYRADLMNIGPALPGVTATLARGNRSSFQLVQGQNILHFAPVPANSKTTSSNTFTILVDHSTPFDFANLQWTFATAAAAPVANAGPNQRAQVGQNITLDGSGSTNPSGNGTLTYLWGFTTRPSGSTARLFNAASVMPSFVVDVAGNYVITLTVSNGTDSSSSSVTVSTGNTPPVANAGSNQTVPVGSTVNLNGSLSSDVDGNPLTYKWTLTNVPPGSTATLAGANTVSPSFVADKFGTYLAQLIVNDGTVDSSPSTVNITTTHTPPLANAGANQVVSVGALVQLNGSGSTDVDGDPLTYQWTLISLQAGSTAALNNLTAVNPSFTADLAGTYVAQLIVNDGNVNSAPSTTTVTTNSPLAPTANAGPSQVVVPGTIVTLNGSGTDPQGLPLTFQWSLTTRPVGSTATLVNPSIANPTFLADVPGTYVAQLIVNNGSMNSAPATVIISTTSTPPVANAGANQNATVSTTVVLDGSGSSDANHQPLSFTWSFLSQPIGSHALLTAANTVSPTFVPDVAGTYVVQLIVNNGFTNSSPATVTITTVATMRITLTPNPLKVSAGTVGTLTLTLPASAGPGGLTLNLSSIDTNIATVPLSITVPANTTSADVTVTGVCACPTPDGAFPGNTTIVATDSSGLYQPGSAMVNVVAATVAVTLDSGNVGIGGTLNGIVTLSAPAPAGGATVTLSAAPNGIVDVQPVIVMISQGNTTGSFTVKGLALGPAIITASSTGFVNGTVNVNVGNTGVRIALTPNPLTVSTGIPGTLTLTLPFPAGPAGLTVNLSSIDTNIATVPPTAMVPANSKTVNFTVTGVCACPTPDGAFPGNTTIVATDSTGTYQPGSAMVNVIAATIAVTLDAGSVGVTRTLNGVITLSAPAGAGGATIALSTTSPGIVDVQPLSVTIIQGNSTGLFTVKGLAPGSAIIMASSSGFTSGTVNVNVGLLGAILLPGNVKVGPNQSAPFPVNLATPAPVGGVMITLTSSDTSIAQVPPSVFIDFKATTPVVQPQVTGIKPGSVTITASAVGLPDNIANVAVVPALTITTTSLADGVIGASYSQTLTATGGTGTYTWKVTQGRLPPGLTLNASTGEISGIPTTQVAGSSVTFQVTDTGNPAQTATALFTISTTF